MKAIKLYQPFASMIATGEKTIVVRFTETEYRGQIVICSRVRPVHRNLPNGCALAIAKLVGCREMTEADQPYAQLRWAPGRYSWLLEDILRFSEPVQVNIENKTGLFELDEIQEGGIVGVDL